MWLPRSFHSTAVALLTWSALVRDVAAQVTTDCNPLNATCPVDPALGTEAYFHFNRTPSFDIWETTMAPVEWSLNDGATFTIKKQGDSPTIRSKFYIFGGRTEIWMKAATGTGVISSVMFLSDDLDEIDWEFLGGDNANVQTNYYGKGFIPEKTNGGMHPVTGGVQDDYHNYTTDWRQDRLEWWVDGALVRTLYAKDANDTYYYPQTPMRLSLGIWAGGDPRLSKGVNEWAGGVTDYDQAPFSMFVKSVQVQDYSSGKEYAYGDRSGSWESIKIVEGNSTIKEVINAPPAKSLSEKWNDLPSGTKIGIYAGAAGFVGILFFVGLFYCIRQRRRGARENRAAEARAETERLELERFKKAGIDPDSFTSSASEYNAKEMRRGGVQDDDSYSIADSPAVTTASPLDFASSMGPAAVAGGLGGAGAGAMRSPVSARAASPSVYSDRAGSTRSPAPSRHPQSPGPSMMSPTQQYAQPNRSYSSPNAQMRMGSPAPSQHGFGGMDRSGSPAPIAHPQPQRSFTADRYGAEDGGRGGQSPQASYGNGGNQGYWGNGGGGGGYR